MALPENQSFSPRIIEMDPNSYLAVPPDPNVIRYENPDGSIVTISILAQINNITMAIITHTLRGGGPGLQNNQLHTLNPGETLSLPGDYVLTF